MTTRIEVKGGVFHRHDRIDHAIGDRARRYQRDLATQLGRKRDGNDPFGTAFSFTQEEYALLQRIRPDLFDKCMNPLRRRQLWAEFANTSEGRAFLVRR